MTEERKINVILGEGIKKVIEERSFVPERRDLVATVQKANAPRYNKKESIIWRTVSLDSEIL